MNRFVPIAYDSFKRLALQLKKKLGLRHCEALEILSRASGFKGFNEVAAICRSDRLNMRPSRLQYAGDLGFDVWREQVIAVIGAERLADMEPELRYWYQWIFEVGGDPAYLPPHSTGPDSVTAPPKAAAAGASLPEEGRESPISPAKAGSPLVVVTYRRRKRLIDGP